MGLKFRAILIVLTAIILGNFGINANPGTVFFQQGASGSGYEFEIPEGSDVKELHLPQANSPYESVIKAIEADIDALIPQNEGISKARPISLTELNEISGYPSKKKKRPRSKILPLCSTLKWPETTEAVPCIPERSLLTVTRNSRSGNSEDSGYSPLYDFNRPRILPAPIGMASAPRPRAFTAPSNFEARFIHPNRQNQIVSSNVRQNYRQAQADAQGWGSSAYGPESGSGWEQNQQQQQQQQPSGSGSGGGWGQSETQAPPPPPQNHPGWGQEQSNSQNQETARPGYSRWRQTPEGQGQSSQNGWSGNQQGISTTRAPQRPDQGWGQNQQPSTTSAPQYPDQGQQGSGWGQNQQQRPNTTPAPQYPDQGQQGSGWGQNQQQQPNTTPAPQHPDQGQGSGWGQNQQQQPNTTPAPQYPDQGQGSGWGQNQQQQPNTTPAPQHPDQGQGSGWGQNQQQQPDSENGSQPPPSWEQEGENQEPPFAQNQGQNQGPPNQQGGLSPAETQRQLERYKKLVAVLLKRLMRANQYDPPPSLLPRPIPPVNEEGKFSQNQNNPQQWNRQPQRAPPTQPQSFPILDPSSQQSKAFPKEAQFNNPSQRQSQPAPFPVLNPGQRQGKALDSPYQENPNSYQWGQAQPRYGQAEIYGPPSPPSQNFNRNPSSGYLPPPRSEGGPESTSAAQAALEQEQSQGQTPQGQGQGSGWGQPPPNQGYLPPQNRDIRHPYQHHEATTNIVPITVSSDCDQKNLTTISPEENEEEQPPTIPVLTADLVNDIESEGERVEGAIKDIDEKDDQVLQSLLESLTIDEIEESLGIKGGERNE